MKERFPEQIDTICSTVTSVFKDGLSFIREECKEIVPSVDANLVTSCLNLLEAFLTSENLDLKKVVSPDKVVMVYLTFSIIWSLGANLYDTSRKNFHRFLKLGFLTLN